MSSRFARLCAQDKSINVRDNPEVFPWVFYSTISEQRETFLARSSYICSHVKGLLFNYLLPLTYQIKKDLSLSNSEELKKKVSSLNKILIQLQSSFV